MYIFIFYFLSYLKLLFSKDMNLTDLHFIPIDLPIVKINLEKVKYECNYSYWQFIRLLNFKGKYAESNWTEYALQNFLDLKNYIEKYLPFDYLVNVKINMQNTEVLNHVDFTEPNANPFLYTNNKYNEPCGYRILIKGKSDKLFVKNKRTLLPETTNIYCIGHTNTIHKVEEDIGRITIFVHGCINKYKHTNLLQKSYNKYKKYCI